MACSTGWFNCDQTRDCECQGIGCNGTSCQTYGPTSCGPFVCDGGTEFCLKFEDDAGDMYYSCRSVVSGCETDRTCGCLQYAIDVCATAYACNDVATNVIHCDISGG